VRAQRLLDAAAATLAGSVAADSAAEHYRAGFHNPAMFAGPLVSAALFAVTAKAAVRPGPSSPLGASRGGAVETAVLVGAALTGLIGFGFHLINTSRRVGGWRSSANVFYGAPVAAPLAATMAGVLGIAASAAPAHRHRAGVVVGRLAALGLVGTAAEAGALHFRGAFQHPYMYAPVVIPPVAAAALATATCTRSPAIQSTAGHLLRLTAWMGIAGAGFHAWGVHRRMGGWRNVRQNLLAGPPLPAPPSFTGLSLAGLAALELLDARDSR
jgi:hypothetical protein